MTKKAADIAAAALAVATVCLLVLFPVREYDTFWHIANGEVMVRTGHVVTEELFSHTAKGVAFDNFEWLAQILMYLAWDAGGADGLLVGKVALSGLIGLTLFAVCRSRGAGPWLSAILVVTAVVVGLCRFTVRPQLFSFLGITVLLWILFRYRAGRMSAGHLAWVVGLVLVWNFLHGALHAVLVLGAFVVGESAALLARGRLGAPMEAPRIRGLWLAAAATGLVLTVNPFGLLAKDVIAGLLSNDPAYSATGEFKPTPWEHYEPFWVLLGLGTLVLVASWRKVGASCALLFLGYSVLGMRYQRAVAPFALVAIPIVSPHLVALLERLRSSSRVWLLSLASAVLCTTVVYLKFIQDVGKEYTMPGYRIGTGIDPILLPPGSARFVNGVDLQGNLFNSDRFGGYLAYFIAPEKPIFHFNGQAHVFTALRDFVHDPSTRDRWDINYAIIATPEEYGVFDRMGFVPVYREPTCMVMLKDDPRNQQWLDRYRIQYFSPIDEPSALLGKATMPAIFARLVWEWAVYLTYRQDDAMAAAFGEAVLLPGPGLTLDERAAIVDSTLTYNDHPALWSAKGLLAYQLGDLEAARHAFDEALRGDPELATALINLAYVDYDEGRLTEAEAGFERATRQVPPRSEALYGLGLTRRKAGDAAGARVALERFLEADPGSPWADKARAMVQELQ